MRSRRQGVHRMRKIPTQARARDTIEVIFEATARLVERSGRARLSTNAIAERAGISIGTLYHYFPSKEAILVAMARRELEAHGAAVRQAMSEAQTKPSAEPEREIVRALLRAFDNRLSARRAAIETLIAQDLSCEIARPAQAAADLIAAQGWPGPSGPTRMISEPALFVLTRAVSGVINAAVREGSAHFGTQEFEDELVYLVRGFIGSDGYHGEKRGEPSNGSRERAPDDRLRDEP
jgi:AcrR family transcriptional regulator